MVSDGDDDDALGKCKKLIVIIVGIVSICTLYEHGNGLSPEANMLRLLIVQYNTYRFDEEILQVEVYRTSPPSCGIGRWGRAYIYRYLHMPMPTFIYTMT